MLSTRFGDVISIKHLMAKLGQIYAAAAPVWDKLPLTHPSLKSGFGHRDGSHRHTRKRRLRSVGRRSSHGRVLSTLLCLVA